MPRALSELAQVNPQVNLPGGAGALTPVSFVPMVDVTESGHWCGRQVRALREVSNGFTAFADGDILVAKITPCFENGKGAQVIGLENGIGFGSTEFHVLRARDGISARFVYHIAQSERLRRAGEVYMSGSAGQKRVPREFFDAFEVPDLPLQEQQSVSTILDTLDTTIRQTEAIVEKLKQVKKGLLHDLLTRGIGGNGELRPPQNEAPRLYKDSPLGLIPREWEVRPAEEVCAAVIDCKNRTPPDRASGHAVIRTSNVRDGQFVSEGLTFTDAASYAIWTQRGKPRAGDILITREAPVGEVCLLPAEIGEACLGQRMMMYRPAPDALDGNFMLVALLSARLQKVLGDLSGGSTVGHVRVGDIRTLPIPIPSLDEQRKIASSFDTLQRRLLAEESVLVKLAAQKSGLMDDLLTGRVRVTPLLA